MGIPLTLQSLRNFELKTIIMPPASARRKQEQKEKGKEKEKTEQEKKTITVESSPEKSKPKSNSTDSDTIKKEDFRKYLENEGILDFVTRKLIGLYKQSDKPSGDEYLKNNFNGKETEEEKKKVEKLENEKQKIQEEIDHLKKVQRNMNH